VKVASVKDPQDGVSSFTTPDGAADVHALHKGGKIVHSIVHVKKTGKLFTLNKDFDPAHHAELLKHVSGQTKTAAMKGAGGHFEGDSGVAEVVDGWLEDLRKHNTKPIVKEAFAHISKQQWEAIQKSEAVKKVAEKYGSFTHPQVTNKMYEVASKMYGFFPRIDPAGQGPLKSQKPQAGGAQKPAQKPAAQGQTKKASAREGLLQAIAPTLRETDVERFVEQVASDPAIVAGFRRAGITETLVDVFENTKRASAEDRLQVLSDMIQPSVVTIQRLPGGDFLVKSANVNAFGAGDPNAAQGQVVPEQQMGQMMGEDQAQQMQPGQTATAVSDPVEPEEPQAQPNEKVVDEFGEWLVQDMMGNRLLGWVFPKTLAWDGNFSEQPIALFTNGSAFSLQDAIAGELVGKGTTLPSDVPRGEGVFYYIERGGACCTAPVTIASAMAGPDGLGKFVGTDVFGTQVIVSHMDGLKKPMRVSDTEYALPPEWKFMCLNNQTQLVPDPVQMTKAAEARRAESEVTLFWNGAYQLEGGCGLDKVASDLRYDMDAVHTEFMLGLLGVESRTAKQKIAQARKQGAVKLAGLKTIYTLAEHYGWAQKTAAATMEKIPELRRDLVKEAAAVPADGDTVNSILALNFINPENLTVFVDYLPELEQTSEKLAEMLLTSYLGAPELPEGAIERSMKNMEEVISALKAISHAEA
jgi:hypothetical protein